MPRRKTHEEFVQEIHDLAGEEYIVTGEYINSKTKVLMKHTTCGREFTMQPNQFIQRGSRCTHCLNDSILNKYNFKSKVLEKFGDEYEILSEYINNKTKIKIRHALCGTIFEKTPKHFFYREQLCPCVAEKLSKEKITQRYIEKIYNEEGNDYTLISEYSGCENRVTLRHNVCGNEFPLNAKLFYTAKQRCPFCEPTASKGEQEIRRILHTNNINYQPEMVFDDCRGMRRPLPFDFAVFDNNDKLIMLIEYDGRQHFKPVNFGGVSDQEALEGFNILKSHDSIKDTYCNDNKIPLLRIPYWEFRNIETILYNELQKYTLI